MRRLLLHCITLVAVMVVGSSTTGTSIAKPTVTAQLLKSAMKGQYEIEVTNVTSYPAYLVLVSSPDLYIDKKRCEVVLSSEASLYTYAYDYSPEIRFLLPKEKTKFTWQLPEYAIKECGCLDLQVSFRVAYLLEQPTGIITQQYVAAHQILTESESVDYP